MATYGFAVETFGHPSELYQYMDSFKPLPAKKPKRLKIHLGSGCDDTPKPKFVLHPADKYGRDSDVDMPNYRSEGKALAIYLYENLPAGTIQSLLKELNAFYKL